MARRKSKASHRQQTADIVRGSLLGIIGIVLLIGIFGAVWWLKTTRPALDKQTLCPPIDELTGIHIVLLDHSDPATPQQVQAVQQELRRLTNEAAEKTRFDVYAFDGNATDVLEPKLRICVPPRPTRDMSSNLYQNPKMIKRRYEEGFVTLLEEEVKKLILDAPARQISPIIESLKAATQTSFGNSSHMSGRFLHITIVSDMVQNTSSISHFRSEPTATDFFSTIHGQKLRPQLRGAQVRVLYLLRPQAKKSGKSIQNRGHLLFWEKFISGAGGRLVSVEPI